MQILETIYWKGTVVVLFLIFLFVIPKNVRAAISFTISNPSVNELDEVEVDATISGLIASSCSTNGCYLQAEFLSSGGYFGYTFNNSGEFVDYFKNPGTTDEIKSKLFNFMPTSGCWSGKLKAKNNPLNPFYYGSGIYPLTFRRFSGNSTGPTSGDSNPLAINFTLPAPTIVPTEVPQAQETTTPTSAPIVLKTPAPTFLPTTTPMPTKIPTHKPTPTPGLVATEAAEVLGINDESAVALPSVAPTQPVKNDFPVIAVIFVGLGITLIVLAGYLFFVKQKQNRTGILNE